MTAQEAKPCIEHRDIFYTVGGNKGEVNQCFSDVDFFCMKRGEKKLERDELTN